MANSTRSRIKRNYSDAERADYWKERALSGGGSSSRRTTTKEAEQYKTKSKTKVLTKEQKTLVPGVTKPVTYIKAWMYRKSVGLVSFFVAPLKDQQNIVSKKTGEVLPWRTAVVEVINKRHMSKSTFSCLVHEHNLSVSIPELRVYIDTKKDFVSVIPKKK